ncbi:MAG: L,D-transpeptidase family protein, partial [Hyphomicrobiaceae bacterium]|nr:L,D-transpeptidase family protein [Hyphomicrobiaceae bacterium]
AAAALRYARHVSGGRVDPATLSRFNDLRGTDADPDDVLAGLATADKPAAFLLSLHPKHPQYQKLHLALVKLRHGGTPAPEASSQPAAAPIPAEGPTLKSGSKHKDVALIRARLAVPGDGADETFDDAVATAVKSFQSEKGLKQTGAIDKATRAALAGAEPRKKIADPAKDMERIALNMERWRWMPRDLGAFHIVNNVPEFQTRVFKNGQIVHQERIIVGKTNTPTPVFSANMQFVIFHPEWGVPDSIKVKEIWPSLRRKSPDDLFGSTADTRILQRQNIRVSYNGHVIDASKVDWSTADPRQYSFIQAAGGGNVLGVVKFRFPNKHDVYMHDTQERSLFQQSARAYSHGCMRVNNPRRLAEVILANAESEAWTPDKVGAAIAGKGTQEVKLDRPFPVHSIYLTAWVDETTDKVSTFGDLYGHDARLSAALAGKPVSLEPQESKSDITASVREQINRKKQNNQDADPVSSFLSGLFAN